MTRASAPALSVLDTSSVWQGASTAQALRDSLELAVAVDQLGYTRYWVAEHHNTANVASSAPAVLIGRLAAATATLRVGSGGVMLPNHAPLVVAEQFGTLEAFHPGRIDLGVGRAPGTDPATAAALRRAPEAGPEFFAQQVDELRRYFDEPGETDGGNRTLAVPALGNRPAMWLLGSSSSSARLAGEWGLPFAFAHHFNPSGAADALEVYRRSFRPSRESDRPYTIVAASVIGADTDERAEWLSLPLKQVTLNLFSGNRATPNLGPDQVAELRWPPAARQFVAERLASSLIGGPETLRRRAAGLLEETGADELMALTPVHDPKERVRSYELLAEVLSS
ncbi:luciferase family oxidoreductase, group 1 [Actinomadura meyerae]|jgi:luciferase family oxidoreductase group 1|uniref:Luciferase family oxidoreductase, group 1 n=1 Tax=Actinomadura meyerae TaxID=240840 RepID=A0A239NGP7_9ACTN|nr:LLM class flavin-dependent oxidoreductase [Actinomadura meyerae]SNT53712.1 luciferase family oxidoreductase, group 1 [Actinomadura meyerae]